LLNTISNAILCHNLNHSEKVILDVQITFLKIEETTILNLDTLETTTALVAVEVALAEAGEEEVLAENPKKKITSTPIYILKKLTEISKKPKKSSLKFSDLGINPKLVKTIEDRGFTNPTQIQEAIIPKMIVGKDVIGVSQTGGGKTGAYLIPILNQYANNKVSVDQHQTLIIVPTRELAYQIEKELYDFDIKQLRLWPLICIGGTDMRRQMSQARKTNQFVIGTPGRLTDMINRGAINLQKVHTIILDEMDRMLDMGFIDEITDILQNLPANVQKGFFSATLK
jgi:ATP-dependent RNA helicase RhlE